MNIVIIFSLLNFLFYSINFKKAVWIENEETAAGKMRICNANN